MAGLTAEQKLEAKAIRKIALAPQQLIDHKAKIDEINVERAIMGLRLIGAQSA